VLSVEIGDLVAFEEIRRLKARYCLYVDLKRWDALGDLFSHDAVFEFNDRDTRLVGRAEIAAYVAETVGESRTSHHASCADIELVTADDARATWELHYTTEDVAQAAYGFYEDEYRRDGGTWRFHRVRRVRAFGHPAVTS
jgi:hypothetical protein